MIFTLKNKKKAIRQPQIEQFYVIKIEARKDRIEMLDFAFKNYAESRKTALDTIRKKNNLNLTRLSIQKNLNEQIIFREISPDCWENKEETISIQVIRIKDLSFKSTLSPKHKTKALKTWDCIEEEIKL